MVMPGDNVTIDVELIRNRAVEQSAFLSHEGGHYCWFQSMVTEIEA